MKEKRLLELLGDIDEKYIEEAAPAPNEGRIHTLHYIGIAASIIFVLFISADLLKYRPKTESNSLTSAPSYEISEDIAQENAGADMDGFSDSSSAVNSVQSADSGAAVYGRQAAAKKAESPEESIEESAEEAESADEDLQYAVYETAEGGALIRSITPIPQEIINGLKTYIKKNGIDGASYCYDLDMLGSAAGGDDGSYSPEYIFTAEQSIDGQKGITITLNADGSIRSTE